MSKIRRSFVVLAAVVVVSTLAGAMSGLCARPAARPDAAVPAWSISAGAQDEGLGIPHADQMIKQLTAPEKDKFLKILGEKPVEEARSYLVTRYFLRVCKAISKLSNDMFDEADRKNIKDHFDIDYCVDFNEELDAMNALLFFGIDPVKGVVSKVKK